MARIYIKKREFPIIKPNDVAKKIKDKKFGDNGVEKVSPSDLINLGDEWAGTYGEIRAIEMDSDKPKKDPFYIPPVSPEEEARVTEMIRNQVKKLRGEL